VKSSSDVLSTSAALFPMALNQKRFVKLSIILLVNLLAILFVSYSKWIFVDNRYSLLQQQLEQPKARSNSSSNTKIKSILFWNGPRRSEMTIFGTGHDAFVQQECPVSDCEIVNSPYQYPYRPLSSFDAVIFNFNDEFWLTKRPHFQRQPHQRFIFFTIEPPPSNEPMNVTGYTNYFNWTMTYRLDSDVPFTYGRIRPKRSAPTTSEEIQARIKETHSKLFNCDNDINSRTNCESRKNKTLVAAMISHCSTDGRREHYIKRLKKHVKVDVYGFCDEEDLELGSGLRCQPHELLISTPECYDMLESKYKFYLSFENAICSDYVTEKFFHIMGRRNIVPIVYGGADYAQLAPEHSYIDALEYEPEQLAQYLKMLDANDTLYNEYLWWKNDYVVESDLRQMVRHGFCDLCRKLHQDQGQVKYYPSLLPKWHPGRCFRPHYKSNRSTSRNKGLTKKAALHEILSWTLGESL
jgi:alpha-1,3-fucosyltransferase